MQVAIVGPGRLGRSLEALLAGAGHEVTLAGRGAAPRTPVVLLTVPDDAIAEAAAHVPLGRVVLHCSGATDVEVLRPHRPAGSLHPLMTFPGPEVALPDLRDVPAALAGDPEAIEAATDLARSLGMRVFEVPGDRRLYHAAAVMAGNFATVLLAEAAEVLAAAGVDSTETAGLLAPLALQSLRNAARDPAGSLTGPVARGDEQVLTAHRAALDESGLEQALETYDVLTRHARRLAASDREND